MASTAAVAFGLSQLIDSWAVAVAPIASRDPAAFYQTDVDMPGLVRRLRAFIENPKWDDSLVIRVTNSDLANLTTRLNQTFGTNVFAPQFEAPAVPPGVLDPGLTPPEIATLGTGVDFSEFGTLDLTSAALIDSESQAAVELARRLATEPPAPPLDTPDVSGEIQPDARLAVAEPTVVLERKTFGVRTMPNGTNVYGEPILTPPFVRQPVPAAGGFDLFGAGFDLLTGLLQGESFGEAFIGAAGTGLGITDTGDQLAHPGGPGLAPGLQQDVLNWMKNYPPTFFLGWTGQMINDAYQKYLGGGGAPSPGVPSLPIGVNGQACDFPTTVSTTLRTVHSAPPGFVVVTCNINGLPTKQAMWKPLAIKLGLWKRPKKPPVSAAEWSTVKKANRVEARIRKVLGPTVGLVKKKAPVRRAAATCK